MDGPHQLRTTAIIFTFRPEFAFVWTAPLFIFGNWCAARCGSSCFFPKEEITPLDTALIFLTPAYAQDVSMGLPVTKETEFRSCRDRPLGCAAALCLERGMHVLQTRLGVPASPLP